MCVSQHAAWNSNNTTWMDPRRSPNLCFDVVVLAARTLHHHIRTTTARFYPQFTVTLKIPTRVKYRRTLHTILRTRPQGVSCSSSDPSRLLLACLILSISLLGGIFLDKIPPSVEPHRHYTDLYIICRVCMYTLESRFVTSHTTRYVLFACCLPVVYQLITLLSTPPYNKYNTLLPLSAVINCLISREAGITHIILDPYNTVNGSPPIYGRYKGTSVQFH